VTTVASPRLRPGAVDVRELEERLRARVDGEVRFDVGSRGTYATDASNYRHVPLGVVVPQTVDAGVVAVAICHELGAPIVSRGGGTSLAGQACNVAVVIDWTKYCDRIESVDEDERVAVIEPGIVLDELNRRLAPRRLQFGPRPSTHSHCALGGMIGNNSCGATAQAYGKTVDNVRRLEVVTSDGLRTWVGRTSDADYDEIQAAGGRRAELYRGLRELVDEYGDDVRQGYPQLPRRVSGYNLDSLLPEAGFDVAKALVGSESTLVTVLRAEIELVPTVAHAQLVVLGYRGLVDAARDVVRIGKHQPTTLECVDDKLIDYEREEHRNSDALELLPRGSAWLFVELSDDDEDALRERIDRLVGESQEREDAPEIHVYDDDAHITELRELREAGLGTTARVPGLADAWPGWEDSAVPPEVLGDYLAELLDLFEKYGYQDTSVYGHFGQGCVHCSIPFDLLSAPGIEAYKSFVDEAARLVVRYGGSLSGEHGDGQARAELLPLMFGDRIVEAFGKLKDLFDPDGLMNPGRIARPLPRDADLRLGTDFAPTPPDTVFAFTKDAGSFVRAAQRCVGVGNCRSHEGGVMCPSYRATGEEEHSTRGRSRLLFEMMNGHGDGPIEDGWRSEAVKDALDLCLACKGCSSDCPVHVDMATYKAEFLHHHYEGRVRPAAHYTMGWLPVWSRLMTKAPGLVNTLTHLGPVTRFGQRLGGVEPDRPVPYVAPYRFSDAFRRRAARPPAAHGDVMLWPDTFTDTFAPEIGVAAVAVLEDAGYRVRLPRAGLCCGLTWISTGQLGVARRVLRRTVDALTEHVRAGGLVVGLEPSCTAVFRSDAHELFPHDEDVRRLQVQTKTLAELLTSTPGWEPPHVGGSAVVQPHCHQHAVLHDDADRQVLQQAGVESSFVKGCCGLAGDFGFTAGHLDVSVACAQHDLLPAASDAEPGAVLVADGFSCRTQAEQLDAGRPFHLAELLAVGLSGGPVPGEPRRTTPRQRLRDLDEHLDRRNGPWPT
jgi:FAD/FMN-containing dehydrogenase/Fe-S oxidoreductase